MKIIPMGMFYEAVSLRLLKKTYPSFMQNYYINSAYLYLKTKNYKSTYVVTQNIYRIG